VEEEDVDGVSATEIWESREAHDASLQLESVRERIGHAMPLIENQRYQAAAIVCTQRDS
jgi:hypothetical protein